MAQKICTFILLLINVYLPICNAALAAMSIDFGSQYTKVGLVKPGVPMEIVLNRESRRKTASLVSIRNDERNFGDPALTEAVRHPATAYGHLIDLLGKKFDHPSVQHYQRIFPFYKIQADEIRGTVDFYDEQTSTTYSVESLVAMLLREFRRLAEAFAEQTVPDVIITVPAFFNQAERNAVLNAADVAGLNLLQLINDNTAAGINYGMFRRKLFNETVTRVLLYDMGASKTVASVFEYQLVKDKVTLEKNPQMTTRGVGFDRTLGGREITLLMRDHLVKHFTTTNGKTLSRPVTEVPRAMAKLWKEAERVKQVLSANPETLAQVENVMEDVDLKLRVTREELEEMGAEIFKRAEKPVTDALKMAELSVDQIDTVVLMGGSTRIPKVQEYLQAAINGKELGKYINADEAAALGAVYQAAHQTKGFRVKKFIVKDMNLYPIQVDFERESISDAVGTLPTDESLELFDAKKVVHRMLYNVGNPVGMKKVMTFNRHTKDFEFFVNYGPMKGLDELQIKEFGSFNITRADVHGLTDALNKQNVFIKQQKSETEEGKSGENDPDSDDKDDSKRPEYKGVKVHFRMDESSVLTVDSAEVIIERPATLVETAESAISSFGAKVRSFFSSSGDDAVKKADVDEQEHDAEKKDGEQDGAQEKKEDAQGEQADKAKSDEKTESTDENKTDQKVDPKSGADEIAKNQTKKVDDKPKIEKIPLKLELAPMDLPAMTREQITAAREILRKFDDQEESKRKREIAMNALESFIFETNDKLGQDEFNKYASESERTELSEKLAASSTWLEDETDLQTKTEDFESRLSDLKQLAKDWFSRMKQIKELPKIEATLKDMLNSSVYFLESVKNLTEEQMIFTETELSTLGNLVNKTMTWWSEKKEEQSKLQLWDKRAYTVADVTEKARELDREIKYLLHKMKITPPKKPKNDTAANDTTESGGDTGKGSTETDTESQSESKSDTELPSEDEVKPDTDTESLPDSDAAEIEPDTGPDSPDESERLSDDKQKTSDEHTEF